MEKLAPENGTFPVIQQTTYKTDLHVHLTGLSDPEYEMDPRIFKGSKRSIGLLFSFPRWEPSKNVNVQSEKCYN
jgi:hypothetical protein